MRIGIITFWNSQDNYGQLLQCYALQRHLRSMGHDPFLIRYLGWKVPKVHKNNNKVWRLAKYLCLFPVYIRLYCENRRRAMYAKQAQFQLRDFDGFRRDYLTMSDCTYYDEELQQEPPVADAYICGSDQIWSDDSMYYLAFAPDEAVKLAYAPSMGGMTHFDASTTAMQRQQLARLRFIGMREQQSVDYCHSLGFTGAVKVVDPTLLLSREAYLSIARTSSQPTSRYAFVYLLGNPIVCDVRRIFDYITDHALDYRYVASQGRVDKYDKTYATINEWIAYISNADVVITNSFHCVAFSLIFNKPFIFIPLADAYRRMNGRIEELLKVANLKSQMYAGDFNKIPLDIDFTTFNSYQREQQDYSTSLLQSYLQ